MTNGNQTRQCKGYVLTRWGLIVSAHQGHLAQEHSDPGHKHGCKGWRKRRHQVNSKSNVTLFVGYQISYPGKHSANQYKQSCSGRVNYLQFVGPQNKLSAVPQTSGSFSCQKVYDKGNNQNGDARYVDKFLNDCMSVVLMYNYLD